MPSYELLFITKRLSKKDLVSCLKRTGELVLNSNGILRKIENLGTRALPYKIRTPIAGQKKYTTGNFFLYHFDVPPQKLYEIIDSLKLDNDLMKVGFTLKETKVEPEYECTLEEELQPPSFRKSVQKLIEEGRKKQIVYDKGTEEM
jgi:small subunit ribosomal protein S6